MVVTEECAVIALEGFTFTVSEVENLVPKGQFTQQVVASLPTGHTAAILWNMSMVHVIYILTFFVSCFREFP